MRTRAGLRLAATSLIAGSAMVSVAVLPAAIAHAGPARAAKGTPTGGLLATLSNPDASAADLFGASVAVSGTIAAVGAGGADSGAGAAYIYTKGQSGWSPTPAVTLADPQTTANDEFGDAVAVSGTTLVVGAKGADDGAGIVYIYVKGASGWPSAPTATLSDPESTALDDFGDAVAASGKTVIVGAEGIDSRAGAAWIYTGSDADWNGVAVSDPGATANDSFGWSVAASGSTAVVGAKGSDDGAGASYIYVKGSSGWAATPTDTLADPEATVGDAFGYSVAVSGKTVVVGSYGTHDDSGSLYIYTKVRSGWPFAPTAILSDPGSTANEDFGWSVAVAGSTVVVGAVGAGSGGVSWIFTERHSDWYGVERSDPVATTGDLFGDSVAASGRAVTVGSSSGGANDGGAYIYSG